MPTARSLSLPKVRRLDPAAQGRRNREGLGHAGQEQGRQGHAQADRRDRQDQGQRPDRRRSRGGDASYRGHRALDGNRGTGIRTNSPMAGKKYREAAKKIDRDKRYPLEEAIKLVAGIKIAKFDETVEMAVRLSVDPRQADQNVRGTVVLPNGTGKVASRVGAGQGREGKRGARSGRRLRRRRGPDQADSGRELARLRSRDRNPGYHGLGRAGSARSWARAA